MKTITYKKIENTSFYIGYSVKDCYLIDHLLGHSPTNPYHEAFFDDYSLFKLKQIAKMHGYKLKDEDSKT